MNCASDLGSPKIKIHSSPKHNSAYRVTYTILTKRAAVDTRQKELSKPFRIIRTGSSPLQSSFQVKQKVTKATEAKAGRRMQMRKSIHHALEQAWNWSMAKTPHSLYYATASTTSTRTSCPETTKTWLANVFKPLALSHLHVATSPLQRAVATRQHVQHD